MEQCIFDLGIISYNPVITWTVPVVFFFLVLVAGIASILVEKVIYLFLFWQYCSL